MKIEVIIENPKNMEMILALNNQQEFIYDSTTVIFEVEETGEYELIFQQKQSPQRFGIMGWIGYILFFWLLGIVNICLMNTNRKWYQKISPYVMNGKIKLNVTEDMKFTILIIKGSYDYMRNNHIIKPMLQLKGIESEIIIDYIENVQDVKWQYQKSIRSYLSIAMDVIILLSFLCMISTQLIYAHILAWGILVILIGVIIGTLIAKHKQMLKIKQDIQQDMI